MISIRDFNLSEFDSKTAPGTGGMMRVGTLIKLQAARDIYGQAIKVNHAFRTAADAERIRRTHPGAVPKSAHEQGYAVDVRPAAGISHPGDWIKLLDAFWDAGFRRFGIMGSTLHVDDDPGRPAPAIWTYVQTQPKAWEICKTWYENKVSGK
jgi:hypothetical protein